MALNNNFHDLCGQFASGYADLVEDCDDEELESAIRGFIADKGIDPAWEDEAVEVIREYMLNLYD